jgi:hypothetical protein
VRRWRAEGSGVVERAALLVLVLPDELLAPLPTELRELLGAHRALETLSAALRPEVEQLRTQVHALVRRCCA